MSKRAVVARTLFCGPRRLALAAVVAGLFIVSQVDTLGIYAHAESDAPGVDHAVAVEVQLTTIDDSSYALPVLVNGEYDILLLLDTGATETIFNTSALQQRGFNVQRTRKRRQGIFKSGRVGLAQFTDLEIAGISIGEYTATTANYKIDYAYWKRRGLPATEGLLGFDILRKLNAVIDYRNDRLYLHPPLTTDN